ncbi:hypothetical protein MNBD_NITROSPINAE01-1046 [hydrothermal vent metagenome]|uniref:PpiC domain-containing protein n=1 Tax=hydrothermal vent metagenome TaxID=652676 RepID=A0A3B1CAE6_9ZZZZ
MPLLALSSFLFYSYEKELKVKPVVPDFSTALAHVGGKVITLGDLRAEVGRYKGILSFDEKGNVKESINLKKALLNRMIDDTVLEVEADRRNVSVTPDELESEVGSLLGEYDEAKLGLILSSNDVSFEDWKSALEKRLKIRKLLLLELDSRIKIADKETKDYFNEHAEKFKWPERVRASQIMLEDEATAEKIRKKLLNKGDFAKIAREFSRSPDATAGGDLGYFSRGQMPPEFESVVFELKVGQVSEVIKSIYGFHIFKVVAKEKPRAMKYEDARDRIRKILLIKKREKEFKNWLVEIKKELNIEVDTKPLLASSL